MKNKKAPRQQGNQNKQINDNKIHLSPSQSRIVNYLLQHGSARTFELEDNCYVRYAADVVQRIRRKGIDIKTTLEDYYRKDGKISKVGRYTIGLDSLEKAQKAVS